MHVTSRVGKLFGSSRPQREAVVVFGQELDARSLFGPTRTIAAGELDVDGHLPGLHDIVVFSSVRFREPFDPWLRAVLSRAKYAVVVDPSEAASSKPLGPLADRVILEIKDVPLLAGRPSQLTLFKGDLAEPLLRVDDYPTGVRPIAADLGPLHDVLRRIDAAGIRFHLGIVPALLTSDMQQFLRSLRRLVPVVHGYDHAYPEKSALLIARGDPGNARRTVGAFNEFAGQPRSEILRKLRIARSTLEDLFGTAVTGYIPPCNLGDRATGQALVALGYSHYFSERRIPACSLPHFASSFYGRSSEFGGGPLTGAVSLHATWEVDLETRGDRTSLGRFLERLSAEHSLQDRALTRELEDRLRSRPGGI